jgi:hypothetical protein
MPFFTSTSCCEREEEREESDSEGERKEDVNGSGFGKSLHQRFFTN